MTLSLNLLVFTETHDALFTKNVAYNRHLGIAGNLLGSWFRNTELLREMVQEWTVLECV